MINRLKKYYNVDNDLVVPPPPEDTCYPFDLMATTDSSITFTITTCSGGTSSVSVPGNGTVTICALNVFQPAQPSNKWRILIGAYPCE